MDKKRTHEGKFYVIDNPDLVHFGTLTIEENGYAELKIFGGFEKPSPAIDANRYTIFGKTSDGLIISLLECSRRQANYRSEGFDTEIWKAPFVLLGAYLESRHSQYFDRVSAGLQNLRNWVGIDGGESSFTTDGKNFEYRYNTPADVVFEDSTEMYGCIYFKSEFWVGLEFKNEAEQVTRVYFESRSHLLSLNDMIVKLIDFRKFVSFFIGQKMPIDTIILESPHALQKYIDSSEPTPENRKNIEVYFVDNETYGQVPERPVFLLRYDDITDNLKSIYSNWQAMLGSPVVPITGLLLDLLTDQYYYDDNKFLRVWQGVEAFHRILIQDTEALKIKFNLWYQQVREFITAEKLLKQLDDRLATAYEPPAPSRLMELLKQNLTVLHLHATPRQLNDWILEMSHTRNYLTHYDPSKKNKKADSQQMVYYTNLLKALLVVLVFRQLGISEELLKTVTNHSIFYYTPLRSVGREKAIK